MSASAEGNETDPNLTPLLDVVLQLIMFFMITVNFLPSQNLSKNITLPVAQSAVPVDASKDYFVFLDMNEEGQLENPKGKPIEEDVSTAQRMKVYLANQKEKIERAVHEEMGKKQDVKIVIVLRADEKSRYEQIFSLLDSCTKAGYKHWQIRVTTKPKGA